MKRTDMINSKDIIRHRFELDLTHEQIAGAVGVSKSTVSNVLKRAKEAGVAQWPLPEALDAAALQERLYPSGGAQKVRLQVSPDWDTIIKGLKEPRGRRRAKMTQRQLWVEYCEEVEAQGGTAYSYSRFCAKLKDQLPTGPDAAVMRFEYAPGQYAMSDFSGKTLSLQGKGGEIVDVEIFVVVLPYSNLIYAEAVPDQKISHWAMAHRRALEYFGGVPSCLIIDNLKSGVIKPDREEPHLNATFREFTLHYGMATLPARSSRPTDKGAAESAVRTVQSRILLALRNMTFFSLGEMNGAIRRELDKLNEAPMANRESRRVLFEADESAALARLPTHPWEWGEWETRKVARNCHVAVELNYYSIPSAHIGRKVEVRMSERMIEVFLQRGGERIAVHRRMKGKNNYATRGEHMPKRLKAVQHIRSPDYGDYLLQQARETGPNALAWAERAFASRDFCEQAFTSVQGMIGLAKKHGASRIDAICIEAMEVGRFASGFLKSRVANGGPTKTSRRPEPDEAIPEHTNIRGPNYYSETRKGERTP